ncbi:MAG: hypothetical protein QOH05_2106, partial [Acetobacteraceae bacterium]|nr:hypothetical protein [Acetobacteraceae bacterium]
MIWVNALAAARHNQLGTASGIQEIF